MYVYEQSGGIWSETVKLYLPTSYRTLGALFGWSTSVYHDILAASAIEASVSGINCGVVCIFERVSSTINVVIVVCM